jgi:segregation and condensation protein A
VGYEVRQEAFEGPLDLLLHLITKQRVDIYEVSLAEITQEYLEEVFRRRSLDLDAATGFLVVAATLLELKSSRLLPSPAADEEDGDVLEARDMLLARLVESATFRDAGAWISAALSQGESYLSREAGLDPQFVRPAPALLARTTAQQLAAAAARALVPRPRPPLDTSHVAPLRGSLRDAIVELSEVLASGMAVSFEELCGRSAQRADVIVRFLALLELFKAGAVDLSQGPRFGDIRVVWTGEAAAEEVLADLHEDLVAAGDAP